MMIRAASPPDNRRAHARSDYAGVLHLQCAGDSTWFDVHGIDVSAGGFAFASDVELKRGERLFVSVPELETITSGATVRHITPAYGGFLVGVQFDEALPPALERVLCG